VVLVMLDEPHGTKETSNFKTAGWNAAPTVASIVTKIGPMLGVFPMGHEDNFQPLTGLMAIYGPSEAGNNEYGGGAATVRTNAPATAATATKAVHTPAPAPVRMPEDEEETTKVAVTRATSEPADSIGNLIDDVNVQDIANGTGGSGAAQ
jgi:hypothetical protein